MKDAVHGFLCEVEKQLHCPKSIREPFLKQMEQALEDYCDAVPEADEDALSEHFGAPEEIAREFLAEQGGKIMTTCAGSRRRALGMAIGIAAALGLAGWLALQWSGGHILSEDEGVVALVKYAQEDVQEEQPLADVILSTDEPR